MWNNGAVTAPRPARAIDLFAGAGGLSAGVRLAGFEVVGATDIDPDACATYRLNFPDAEMLCGDLRRPRLRSALLELASNTDLVVGGPPCQAFSQVRNHARLLDDPRNALYREFVRVLSSVLPPAFCMENVPGMEQMGATERIADELSLDGEYSVSAQVVDAVNFGVPQTRKRLVFLGVRGSLGLPSPILEGSGAAEAVSLVRSGGDGVRRYAPAARDGSLTAGRLAARLSDADDQGVVSAGEALSDLVVLTAGRRSDDLDREALPPAESAYQRWVRADAEGPLRNTSVPRINTDTVLRLAAIPPGGNHRDLPDDLLERYITGDRWGPDNGTGRLGRRHYYAYRRLHPGIWSWTLNTKADSVYHYSTPRALSVREFARLQSFPDSFEFTTDQRRGELPGRIGGGAAHSRYRQVGNAVPPLLALAISEALAPAMAAARRGRRTA